MAPPAYPEIYIVRLKRGRSAIHIVRLKVSGAVAVCGWSSAKVALYGITRAQNHCTVIVLGQGRLNAQPFAPIPT
jgi:hypothetical protein